MKKVTLLQTDITTLKVDAIVNSANKSLLGGGGVDYIIHKKAGAEMQQEIYLLNSSFTQLGLAGWAAQKMKPKNFVMPI